MRRWRGLPHSLFLSCGGGWGGWQRAVFGGSWEGGVRAGEPGKGGVTRIGPLAPPIPPLPTRAGSRVL